MTLNPIFLRSESRLQLQNSDPHWRLKAILHVVSILFSLIAIVLFAVAIPKWNANFFHSSGPTRGDWTDGMPIGPLAFTCLSSTAIVVLTRLRRRSLLKPSLLISSLILLSLAPSLILCVHGSLFRHWRAAAQRNQSGLVVCNLLNIFSRDCQPVLYAVGELQLAGLVFGALTWTVVFLQWLICLYDLRVRSGHWNRTYSGARGRVQHLPRTLILGSGRDPEKSDALLDGQSREQRRRHNHHHHHRRHHHHGHHHHNNNSTGSTHHHHRHRQHSDGSNSHSHHHHQQHQTWSETTRSDPPSYTSSNRASSVYSQESRSSSRASDTAPLYPVRVQLPTPSHQRPGSSRYPNHGRQWQMGSRIC